MGIPYPSGVPFLPESIAVREMTIPTENILLGNRETPRAFGVRVIGRIMRTI
jgi:hypothetical protein